MEIKINREIRDYTESMFFGLSARQFFFMLFGIVSCVFSYFMFRDTLGTEGVSWLCMIVALPFVLFGFVKYNNQPFERILIDYVKYRFIEPRKLKYESDTIYVNRKRHMN